MSQSHPSITLTAWDPAALDHLWQAGIPPGMAHCLPRVKLVAEELLTNIFRHAYGPEGGQAVVKCGMCHEADGENGMLLLRITDWARPFDPFSQSPVPDTSLNPEERAAGGLGVYLVKALAQRHYYARQGPCNVVEVYFAEKTPE